MTSRVVGWFSNGAASAVASRMALAKYCDEPGRVVLACIDTRSEHPDNARFRADCERWFEYPITVLGSEKYQDIWDVFERTRYLVGPAGARCTGELKKNVRFRFERPDDLHVWGYTADAQDAKRADRFIEQNPGVDSWFPLIEAGLTKADCLALIERAGIELPAMYRLGYGNNNCIGCVKGGQDYWNRIRVDFPEEFARMAEVEQRLGRTVIRKDGKPLPLLQLDPKAGRFELIKPADCDLNCSTVEADWEASQQSAGDCDAA
jgi:3'-phosphoadenosine 5'-phosphosulfate sulfotransferase (PAPS reductase)/FAD synthetase